MMNKAHEIVENTVNDIITTMTDDYLPFIDDPNFSLYDVMHNSNE